LLAYSQEDTAISAHKTSASTIKLIVVCVFSAIASSAANADAAASLKTFLQSTKTLSADFLQQIITKEGKPGKAGSGKFELSRTQSPGRFRFEYVKPYAQTIVADGKQLWLYDKDLNQVTVRKYAEALAASPAAILAGDANVEKFYVLKTLETTGETEWLQATPKSKDTMFENFKFGFNKAGELTQLELKDSFGQTSRISFTQAKRNEAIAPAAFTFTPPAGADVSQQ
jgi:outer membrane lipoprotein carrier protein